MIKKGNEEMEKYVFPSISPGIYVGIIKYQLQSKLQGCNV